MKSLLLLITLSTPLFARIGETREQCIERFGPVVHESKGVVSDVDFKKDDFEISIVFHEGKAESITYKKKDKEEKDKDKNRIISFDKIQTLLKANGEGRQWKIGRRNNQTIYYTADNSRRADVDDLNALSITTIEGLHRQAKLLKEQREKKLKGF